MLLYPKLENTGVALRAPVPLWAYLESTQDRLTQRIYIFTRTSSHVHAHLLSHKRVLRVICVPLIHVTHTRVLTHANFARTPPTLHFIFLFLKVLSHRHWKFLCWPFPRWTPWPPQLWMRCHRLRTLSTSKAVALLAMHLRVCVLSTPPANSRTSKAQLIHTHAHIRTLSTSKAVAILI